MHTKTDPALYPISSRVDSVKPSPANADHQEQTSLQIETRYQGVNLGSSQANATRTPAYESPGTDDRQPTPASGSALTVKTQGEIEAEIAQEIKRFQIEYLGRGPDDVRVFTLGNLILVRLLGVLTAAEKHLVTEIGGAQGRNLVKQIRTQLIEGSRTRIDAIILKITGVKVVSLHHDISTVTGEEILVFTLAESPVFRNGKKR